MLRRFPFPLKERLNHSASIVAVVLASFGTMTAADERLVFTSDTPLRSVHELRFSADSSRLYAAGRDKRVFGWDLFRRQDGSVAQITPVSSLWWPVSRGDRGNVYAIAVTSAAPHRVAIGGFSTSGAGDVSIVDLIDGKTTAVLPVDWNQQFDNGHTTHVQDLDIASDGSVVVSIANDGEVRYWDKSKRWLSTVLYTGDQTSSAVRNCVLRPDGSVLFNRVTAAGAQFVHVTEPATAPKTQVLATLPETEILTVASSTNGDHWLISDSGGDLYFWSNAKFVGRIKLDYEVDQSGRVATSAMFGPNSLLLLNTTSVLKVNGDFQTQLEVWNAESRTRLDSAIVAIGKRAGLATAVSSDGRLAAGIDDDTNSIVLFELDEQGEFRRNANGGRRKRILSGSADTLRHVRFSGVGLRLDIGTHDGRRRIFDLEDGSLRTAHEDDPDTRNIGRAQVPWKIGTAVTKAGPDRRQSVQSFAITHNGDAGHVQLDTDFQGELSVYEWLPTQSKGAPMLAVGTEKGAVLVFRYAGPKSAWQLVRYFRDHSDRISSLSVSHDDRFLASGSADATVKVWSLTALNRKDATFIGHSRWGASFSTGDSGLVVTQIEPAGIAAARGLKAGDLVTGFEQGEKDNERKSRPRLIDQPGRILAAIKSAKPWDQVKFTLARDGELVESRPVVPGWEPLITLYLDRRNEWAMATPRGFYDASADGDSLFGWVVNPRQRNGTPGFYMGKQFRQKYERPKVLRQLFATGNLPDALQQAGIDDDGRNDVAETVEDFPKVRITAPDSSVADPVEPAVTIRALVGLPGIRGDYEVKAWLNGAPLQQPDRSVFLGGDEWEFEWDAQAFAARNRVVVRAQRRGRIHNAVHDEAESLFAANIEESTRRIFFVGIAVGAAYPDDKDSPENSLRLRYTVRDVNAISDAIWKSDSPHYLLGGEPKKLLEENVTRSSVEELCKDLLADLSEASPRDLLVVCLSGHGFVVDSEYYFVPAFDGLRKLAAGDSTTEERIRTNSVSWSLLSTLASLPCRKLFLIDTCHSGRAAEVSVRDKERSSKTMVRTAGALDCLVVAAAAPDEYAYEDNVSRHGYFTRCWLEAIQGNADGYREFGRSGEIDQSVDLLEAIWYVERTVPRLRADQHPTHSPQRLAAFVNMPLLQYERKVK